MEKILRVSETTLATLATLNWEELGARSQPCGAGLRVRCG